MDQIRKKRKEENLIRTPSSSTFDESWICVKSTFFIATNTEVGTCLASKIVDLFPCPKNQILLYYYLQNWFISINLFNI